VPFGHRLGGEKVLTCGHLFAPLFIHFPEFESLNDDVPSAGLPWSMTYAGSKSRLWNFKIKDRRSLRDLSFATDNRTSQPLVQLPWIRSAIDGVDLN
jgi:hypothetical protein